MLLKRIEQIIVEDEFSRRNIRDKLINAVLEGKKEQLKELFEQTVNKIQSWIESDSEYDSKRVRKLMVAAKGADTTATEVFIAVFSCKGVTSIQAVATKLASALKFDEDNPFITVKIAAEILGVCWDPKIYKVYSIPLRIEPTLKFPKEVLEYIENTKYLNPMLCKPDDWSDNFNGGYLSIKSCLVLGKFNCHKEYQAYDAINIAQGIAYELDVDVLLENEEAKAPLDTLEKQEAWATFTRNSEKAYDQILDTGNCFYFPWKYDFRGRMYSQGYYINIQGAEYKKALINTHRKEKIQ